MSRNGNLRECTSVRLWRYDFRDKICPALNNTDFRFSVVASNRTSLDHVFLRMMKKDRNRSIDKYPLRRDDQSSSSVSPGTLPRARNERKKEKSRHILRSSLLATRDYVKARATRVRCESRPSSSLGKMCRVLQVDGRIRTTLSTYLPSLSFSLLATSFFSLPSRPGVSVHRANPVLICPRARDTRRARKPPQRRRNPFPLNSRIVTRSLGSVITLQYHLSPPRRDLVIQLWLLHRYRILYIVRA